MRCVLRYRYDRKNLPQDRKDSLRQQGPPGMVQFKVFPPTSIPVFDLKRATVRLPNQPTCPHWTGKDTHCYMLMRHPLPELQFDYRLPYGANVTEKGVQFTIFSRSATAMRLLLYKHVDDREPSEIVEFDRRHVLGDTTNPGLSCPLSRCRHCARGHHIRAVVVSSLQHEGTWIARCWVSALDVDLGCRLVVERGEQRQGAGDDDGA
jgi:hypothetical protein